MEIKIKIDAPELSNAINSLATALSGGGIPSGWVPGGGEIKADPIKEDTPGPAKTEDKPVKTETKKTEDKPEVKFEKVSPGLTFEQVRVKLAEVSQKGKQKELKELITSFGAGKLSDIPEDKFAELLEKADEL